MSMRTRAAPIALLLPLLAACTSTGDTAVRSGPSPIRPIYSQSDGPRPAAQSTAPEAPAVRRDDSQRNDRAPSQRRRGGSGTSPEPYGGSATAPPTVVAPPGPGSSTDATAAFKRDLLAPKVEDLRQQDMLGRADPMQQRDLLMKQQEMNQLRTDPLRR